VPLRDSKLTRLLSVHLGGNSQTGMLVTMTPAEDAVEASLSTLRFAHKASLVRCAAKPVVISKEQSLIIKQREIIAQLQQRVRDLQEEVQTQQQREPPRQQGAQGEAQPPADEAAQGEREEIAAAQTVSPSNSGQNNVVSKSREMDAIVTALHRNNDALKKQKAIFVDEIRELHKAVTEVGKQTAHAAAELRPGGAGADVALELLHPGPQEAGGSAWKPAIRELRTQIQALARAAFAFASSGGRQQAEVPPRVGTTFRAACARLWRRMPRCGRP